MCTAFLRGSALGLVRGMGAAAVEAACSPVLLAGAAISGTGVRGSTTAATAFVEPLDSLWNDEEEGIYIYI